MEYLDASIPRGYDKAPGTPGNTCAQESREVRAKINEIIANIKLDKHNRGELMTIKETELPETIFALQQYIRYAEKSIDQAHSLMRKMNSRIKVANDKIGELTDKQDVTETR